MTAADYQLDMSIKTSRPRAAALPRDTMTELTYCTMLVDRGYTGEQCCHGDGSTELPRYVAQPHTVML
jgi:hypothetical protein